jgi:deoxyribose-phosphate aldolase
MAEEIDRLAEEIAEKALLRLRAERVGREEPCAPGEQRPAGASALPVLQAPAREEVASCGPFGCGPCTGRGSCGPRYLADVGADRLGMPLGAAHTSPDIARYIDHTLLKPDATRDELSKLCDEASKYGFATVCVNSANVGYCARRLAGSGVRAIAVVGFPLGAMATGSKAYEAREAVRQGAGEIDMVINIGALKSRDYRYVMRDIEEVVKASTPAPVKVILETSMLDNEQKVAACAISKAAGAHFVKTSTGFGGGGATAEDIALMRRVVGFDMGVKASGGVRSREDAERLLMAGADRLGASASIAIVTGSKAGAGKY